MGSLYYSDVIFSRDKRFDYESIDEEDAIVISCKESRGFLKDMGISGEILSTMSHSEDSISLVLDNGVCIIRKKSVAELWHKVGWRESVVVRIKYGV